MSPKHNGITLGPGSPLLTAAGAKRKLQPNEKNVEHMGDQLMARYGFVAVRFSQARATQQTPGIPDRRYYDTARELAVWWEAKAPGGKQRPAQRKFQVMVEACAEHYILGGIDELAGWLRQWCHYRPTP